MTNDGSLTARDIAVIPPVSGQDNVQDALESGGGGGGGGFPVGPLDDGTNTYTITADGSTLATSNTLDADSDANALLQLEVDDATTSSLKAHAQIPGSLTELSLLGSGSFALSADDGTNTHEIRANDGVLAISNSLDAGGFGAVTINGVPVELGGTDGNGNVYSIEYNPSSFPQLSLVCTSPDTTIVRVGVAPGGGVLNYSAPDGSTGDFGLGGNQFEFALSDTDVNVVQAQGDTRADQGFFVQARNGDSSALHSLRVAQVGFEIDGVTVDPAQPWPGDFSAASVPEGDPHVDRAPFTVGYVQGVTPGTLMISAG